MAAEKNALADAEISLKNTQQTSGLILPSGQSEALIRSIAQLRAEIAAREVQLESMRTYATGDNPQVQMVERELAALREQARSIEAGKDAAGSIDVTARRLPEASLDYIRSLRDLKYHEALFEILANQYEAGAHRRGEARAGDPGRGFRRRPRQEKLAASGVVDFRGGLPGSARRRRFRSDSGLPAVSESGVMNPSGTNRLRDNLVALSVLQALNYVVPLITVPYLVRVLGPAHFGMLSLAQALVVYLDLFTNYGFDLSATRAVACLRYDPAALAAAFWRTMYAKAALMLASAAVMALLVASVPRFRAMPMLYAGAFLTVLGSVTFPAWFFQGIERMRPIAIVHASARLLTIPALILLVKQPHDLVRAAAIQGSVPVLASALLLPVACKINPGRPPLPCLSEIGSALRGGWHVFIAQSGIAMNSSTTTVILGLIAGDAELGYYSAADKVIRAVTAMLGPSRRRSTRISITSRSSPRRRCRGSCGRASLGSCCWPLGHRCPPWRSPGRQASCSGVRSSAARSLSCAAFRPCRFCLR